MSLKAALVPRPKVTAITFGVFLLSCLLTVALGNASWTIPITFGHLAAFAFIRDEFALGSLSNLETKWMCLVLAAASFGIAYKETESLAKSRSESAPTTEVRRDMKAPPSLQPSQAQPAKPEPTLTPAQPTKPEPQASTTTSPPEVVASPPAPVQMKEVITTVDDILKTYADNQIAGERRFSNARIRVSGKVIRVREALGTGILVLGSRRSGESLELGFTDSGKSDLSEVSPGQSVEAVCYYIIEMMGAVAISDCRSVKSPAKRVPAR